MFSSSIVRRGRSSLAVPPTTKRCNAIGLGRLATAARRSTPTAAGAVAAPEECRRQTAAFGPAGIGKLHEGISSTARAGCISGLVLEKELASLVEHWELSQSAPPQPRTSGVGATVHVSPLSDGGVEQLLRPSVAAATLVCGSRPSWQASKGIFLDRRCFSTGKVPADTNDSGDSTRSESGSKFEGTLFGTAAAESSSAPAAAEAQAAKKKTPKARIPRKRRSNKNERTSSSPPAAVPAAAAVVAEEAPAEASAAEPTGASKPAAVEIPEGRKTAFERARRAGVTRRAKEGGGVPRDGGSSSSSSSSSSDGGSGSSSDGGSGSSSGGGGGGSSSSSSSSSSASTFQWRETDSKSPFTWKEPATPVRPEGFLAGSGTDGGESGAVAGAEANGSSANASGGKATRRRGQRQRAQQEHHHPVLGHFVADLKYKRVYVTSVEALMKARVWEKARTLRPVHAVEIYQAKKMEAERIEVRKVKANEIEAKGITALTAKGMPGVITLYQRPLLPLRSEKQRYVFGVVDGQHRLGALLLLSEEGLWDRSERNVVVEVFDTKDDKEIEELFAEINKAEPSQVDMNQAGPEEIQKCANDVVFHLYKQYRPMFGGKRIRRPSLHAATFREDVLRSGMIERHELYDPDILLDYLLRVNEMLSQREMQQWEHMIGQEEGKYSSKRSLVVALNKAKNNKFWLGMETSWMVV